MRSKHQVIHKEKMLSHNKEKVSSMGKKPSFILNNIDWNGWGKSHLQRR